MAQERYRLVVTWSPFMPKSAKEVNERIDVAVYPGVPFSVRARADAGKNYEVSGVIHQEAKDEFELDSFRFAETPLGPDMFSGHTDIGLKLKLGQPMSGGVPNQEDITWELTRE
jgi:hypothetical protein